MRLPDLAHVVETIRQQVRQKKGSEKLPWDGEEPGRLCGCFCAQADALGDNPAPGFACMGWAKEEALLFSWLIRGAKA